MAGWVTAGLEREVAELGEAVDPVIIDGPEVIPEREDATEETVGVLTTTVGHEQTTAMQQLLDEVERLDVGLVARVDGDAADPLQCQTSYTGVATSESVSCEVCQATRGRLEAAARAIEAFRRG